MKKTKNISTNILKIGTYNIKHGGNLGSNCQAIGEEIAKEELDVVAIQEVDYFISRSGRQDIIKTIADYANYPYYQFFKALDYHDGEYGLGIISKYPFGKTQKIYLPHCQEQRILVEVVINFGEKKLNLFMTHLELGSYSDVRRHQFALIKEIIKERDIFILAGDFNVEDWHKPDAIFEYDEYFREYQILNNNNHTFYTYHSDYNKLDIAPIDNIITSPNLQIKNVYMKHNHNSDHNLFVGEFIW